MTGVEQREVNARDIASPVTLQPLPKAQHNDRGLTLTDPAGGFGVGFGVLQTTAPVHLPPHGLGWRRFQADDLRGRPVTLRVGDTMGEYGSDP